MSIIPTLIVQAESYITKCFSIVDATSSEKAIEFDKLNIDFEKYAFSKIYFDEMCNKGIIKKTVDNKYWIINK